MPPTSDTGGEHGAGAARRFISEHLSGATRLSHVGMNVNRARMAHLLSAYAQVPSSLKAANSLHLEFGVREGTSINFLANETAGKGIFWDGFDSFRGLPKSSVAVGSGWRAGAFTTLGRMPAVRKNVRLHAGWFNDTLPSFLDGKVNISLAFIHLDADIFESTWTVLENVCARCMLRVGTVLSFDELFAKSQSKILNHEWRALRLASRKFGFKFRFITWMMHRGTPYVRVAVQVTDLSDSRCTASMRTPGRRLSSTSIDAVALSSRCARPRKVYIDMGVNWCNTLTLFRSLPNQWMPSSDMWRMEPWQIYGFEASPLIVAYAEQCTSALSAGNPLPRAPVLPAGSTPELMRMADADSRFNCSRKRLSTMRPGPAKKQEAQRVTRCILDTMKRDLENLHANPLLSGKGSAPLMKTRLAAAASCPGATGRDEFSMIAAAAAANSGTMKAFGSRESLVQGGMHSPTRTTGAFKHTTKVPKVDVVLWMLRSFKEEDFVVLKMDVEGAEHAIVPKLLKHNASRLIDVLLWECHNIPAQTLKCNEQQRLLKAGGVKIVFREPYNFNASKRVLSAGRYFE